MDIKVGEYFRTKYGEIAKVLGDEGNRVATEDNSIYFKDEIVKHSFNTKELIEKGDIVEYKINNLTTPKVARVRKYKEARTLKEYLGVEGYKLEQIKIIRVLTKEQFQSVSYEV